MPTERGRRPLELGPHSPVVSPRQRGYDQHRHPALSLGVHPLFDRSFHPLQKIEDAE